MSLSKTKTFVDLVKEDENKALQFLATNIFDINAYVRLDDTNLTLPIIEAVIYNRVRLVQKLIECKADINATRNKSPGCVSSAMLLNCNIDMLKLLCDNNVKIKCGYYEISNLFLNNDFNKIYDAIQILVKYDIGTFTGSMLCHLVCDVCKYCKSDEKLIGLLVDSKADFTRQDIYINNMWITSIATCLFAANSKKIAEYMIENKANPIIVDEYGISCLHIACKAGNHDLIVYLNQFVSALLPDRNGITPFAVCDNRKSIEYLFNKYKDYKDFRIPNLSDIVSPNAFEYYVGIGAEINPEEVKIDCLPKLFEYNIIYALWYDGRFKNGKIKIYEKQPYIRHRLPVLCGLIDERFDENGIRLKKKPSIKLAITEFKFKNLTLQTIANNILKEGNNKRLWLQLPEHYWNSVDPEIIAYIICSYLNY